MEKRDSTIHTRVTQDRRKLSRVSAPIECTFTDGRGSYRAVVSNLSYVGAYLSARHLPEIGSKLSITLLSPRSKSPIILHAIVVRGSFGTSEIGIVGKFGVKFVGAPLELMSMLKDRAQGGKQAKSTPTPVK